MWLKMDCDELRVFFCIKDCDEEAAECGLEVSISSSTDSDQLQFTRNLFWEVYLGNLYELQKKLKSILDGTDKHEGLYIEEILGADMQFVFDPRTKCVDWHIFLGLSSNCYLSMQLETKQLESLLIYLQVAIGNLRKESPEVQRLIAQDILRGYR